MPRNGSLTISEKILLVLQEKGCCSLEELERYTKVRRNELLVYLTKMTRQGIVTRSWGHFAGKKYRKYCLKTTLKKELNLS
ncbi:DNA-binding protein [Sulfolobus acidocaldarius]|jgi:DNA-binding IclR family transcriptional regulator|uniref:DNA-binding protein n=1 Tax=Sulfolobaceae TaxID=118883 RepID=UPI0007845CB3|nr:DNA-binding protein [Sulfolobus acidocaldarius]